MWKLEAFARNLLKLNEDAAFKKVISDKEIQLEAVRLNTEEQLYIRGVDVHGNKLRSIYARFGQVYSSNTINRKQELGQPTDRVTMRDTGAMYKTMKSIVASELKLDMDTIKAGKDLQEEWGQFVGLDTVSKVQLVDKAKPIIKTYVKDTILQ